MLRHSLNSCRKAKKVHEVLGRIDRKKLAEAAFHCGGYTRALQYMEAQLLQEKKGGLNPSAARSASFSDEEVTFLMQVYTMQVSLMRETLWLSL